MNTEERVKSRRSLNRERRSIKLEDELFGKEKKDDNFGNELTSLKSRNISQDITSMIMEGAPNKNDVARRILFESEKSKREEKLKDIADCLTKLRPHRRTRTEFTVERRSRNQIKPTRDGECSDEEKCSDTNTNASVCEKNEIVRCALDFILKSARYFS